MSSLLDGPWAYLLLFVGALAENSVGLGLVLPIDTLILGAASLAALGDLSVELIVPAVFVGAVVGDSIGFFVGRRFGPALTRRLDGHIGVTEHRIEQARDAFQRWGMWAVAIGRVLPVVRFLVILLAGDLGLPYRRFIVADCVGIAAWLTLHVTIGYALGTSVDALGGTHDLVILAVAAVVVGLAALLLWWWWTHAHHPRPPAPTTH